ncbi:hypothetical protein [Cellulomonas sp. SLBN-39]|uniref:hypothetical protein n=1 Tax=Cellulomonas sp. SLBN-39 TaxID=2768446 RepID=UPI0011526092|nr:hypothetical protein [Cellulomonas sp. SLBN-39]TQL03465.1 hypothetical protein FBY24_2563 [Cellulomonas sp. SLBN-39]
MGNPYAPPEQPAAQQQHAPVDGAPQDVDPRQAPAGAPAGPPPPADGPPGPAPREPDAEGVVRAHRWATGAAAALLVSVLTLSSPYPWALGATPFAVLALACAIVAVVHAGRSRARASVVVMATVLVVASLGWTAVAAQSLLFTPALREHAQCQERALTQQAQRTCDADLRRDLEELTRSLLPSVPQG